MPALLISRPTLSKLAMRATTSLSPSSVPRSAAKAVTLPPCLTASAANSSSRSRRRATARTLCPRRASSRANASPIPEEAPVTTAHPLLELFSLIKVAPRLNYFLTRSTARRRHVVLFPWPECRPKIENLRRCCAHNYELSFHFHASSKGICAHQDAFDRSSSQNISPCVTSSGGTTAVGM